jgi:hypothetical protein
MGQIKAQFARGKWMIRVLHVITKAKLAPWQRNVGPYLIYLDARRMMRT